jgi:hypothetical protein
MQAAMMAHINEHLGYEYKKQIEAQIGIQIPDYEDEQTIPEDMETQIAQRAAQASQQLLQKHQMEAQQQQAQQQMQDPIIQMQMQELQIKQAEVQRKIAKDQADAAAKDKQMQVEMARIDAQKEIAGANMAMKHVTDSRRDAKDEKMEGFRQGMDLVKLKAGHEQQNKQSHQQHFHNSYQNSMQSRQKEKAQPQEKEKPSKDKQ